MKIISDTSKLTNYINHFKVPKKLTLISSDDTLDALEELKHLGEYFFMALALVPKQESEIVFEELSQKLISEQWEEEGVNAVSLHEGKEKDLIVIVTDSDEFLNTCIPSIKKYNHLPYSDEVNIYCSGFSDNDGGLTSMDYELHLELLNHQLFFTPTGEKSMKNLNVCFTGFRDSKLEEKIKSLGGIIHKTVTKQTSLVVSSSMDSGSSKEEKALELGIPVVSIFQLITQYMYENSFDPEILKEEQDMFPDLFE